MNRNDLQTLAGRIRPVSKDWINQGYQRLDSLTKPRRSLGHLEELAARYVAITEQEKPVVAGKRVFVFAGDHKVTQEGVSAYPPEVTGLMVANFVGGGAAINVLARRAGADVEVIDVGMLSETKSLKGVVSRKVKHGADNIAAGPAMSVEEALSAIAVGVERAEAAAKAVSILITGEMGIGNTTPASALFAVCLGVTAGEVVGPGTGLDSAGIDKKRVVIERAVAVNRQRCTGPLEILAALGGLEIAAICGLCLAGAAMRKAVVVDGFISTAGALLAIRMCPAAKDYMFFSHMSAEPGHKRFFETENVRPILDLGMRLGEGTGAAIATQIIEDALAIYNEMATFEDAGIKAGA